MQMSQRSGVEETEGEDCGQAETQAQAVVQAALDKVVKSGQVLALAPNLQGEVLERCDDLSNS